MDLFEWLGESFNPGSLGSMETGGRVRPARTRAAVLVCFVIASIFLGYWLYLVWSGWAFLSMGRRVVYSGVTVLYLVLGFFVHPQPDMSNIGWLGGLMDHPFRYSDDINRFLIFLVIILWPGRFVSESLVDTFVLLRHTRRSASP